MAAFSGNVAGLESAARSAADYAARKQREVDDARAAELPAGVSIVDMENGAHSLAMEPVGSLLCGFVAPRLTWVCG